MDTISQLFDRFSKIWGELGAGGRVGVIVSGVLLLTTVIGVAVWSSIPDYKLLRDGISPADTAAIVSALNTKGIPNKMNYSGTGVMVPTSRWNEANVAISSLENIEQFETPDGSGSSLFPGVRPGHQEVVRSKEIALKRSLESLQVVKSADVHLAVPEPSPFRSKQQPVTASVIVTPHANQSISRETATSIIHTVASAVEGLDPANVSLTDFEGRLIGNSIHEDPAQARREFVRLYESELAMKAQDQLTMILGPNRAIVRVTAEVDSFVEKVTTKNQIIAQDKVRLLERIVSSDQKGMATTAAGVAGSTANDPSTVVTQTTGAQPIAGKTETNETSYDYPRTTEETHEVGGQVLRLSISATVDATVTDPAAAPAGNNGNGPQLLLQQAQVEAIIKSAVGFDATRGDQLGVVMAKFAPPQIDTKASEIPAEDKWAFVAELAKNASLGITAVVALLFGIMTLRKVQPIRVGSSEEEGEQRELLAALSNRVESNPEAVSKILAAWINQQADEPAESLGRAA